MPEGETWSDFKLIVSIARAYFGKRIYQWKEGSGDDEFVNSMYSEGELYYYEKQNPSFEVKDDCVLFDSVATAVAFAFERTHPGLDGLCFKDAKFEDFATDDDCAYVVTQEDKPGFESVDTLTDWCFGNDDPGLTEYRAYWAARSCGNCSILNAVLYVVLSSLNEAGISKLDLRCSGSEPLLLSTLSQQLFHVEPHSHGVFEDPIVGAHAMNTATGGFYHEVLVCQTTAGGWPGYALDLASGQFGISGCEKHGDGKLDEYIPMLAESWIPIKKSILGRREDATMVRSCSRLALKALECFLMKEIPMMTPFFEEWFMV
ncbi:MAG: hypothetical protein SGARI_005778 [Bacillariaceae sp.]